MPREARHSPAAFFPPHAEGRLVGAAEMMLAAGVLSDSRHRALQGFLELLDGLQVSADHLWGPLFSLGVLWGTLLRLPGCLRFFLFLLVFSFLFSFLFFFLSSSFSSLPAKLLVSSKYRLGTSTVKRKGSTYQACKLRILQGMNFAGLCLKHFDCPQAPPACNCGSSLAAYTTSHSLMNKVGNKAKFQAF